MLVIKQMRKEYAVNSFSLKPYNKSKVKLYFKKAEEVDFSKLPKYDLVFTSPPYEYLEVYEDMKNYEGTDKIRQPSSSTKIKMEDSSGFYDDFMIPTIKKAYKYFINHYYYLTFAWFARYCFRSYRIILFY